MNLNFTPLRRLSRLDLFLVAKPVCVLVLLMCVVSFHSLAQTIWGTVSGTESFPGSLFSVNTDGTALEKIPLPGGGDNTNGHGWIRPNHYRLVKCSDGKFYGITLGGGKIGEGILFSFDPATHQMDVKLHFDFYNEEGRPVGSLLEFNGKLYVSTRSLVSEIFSFDLATEEFKIEATFKSTVGEISVINGKFYGMTEKDGAAWAGTIFEFDPATSVKTTLFEFNQQQTGRFPSGNLTLINGKLYGTTTQGGAFAQGTLFSFDLANGTFQKKVDFKYEVNGSNPIGDLTLYNGKLLGATSGGGAAKKGVIFQFDPATDGFTVLMHQGRLIKNLGGKLYGVTTTGGSADKGTLFLFDSFDRRTDTLVEFNSPAIGTGPFGTLALDGNKLWGMTRYGGLGNAGTIFSYDILSHQLSHEFSFNFFPQGKKPLCLVEANEKLYGLAAGGGAFNKGTLFEYDPATKQFSTLQDFNCDGCVASSSNPHASLITKGSVLYGFTWRGGSAQAGQLFKYDLSYHSYIPIHEFNMTYGTELGGDLIWSNDKIYGTYSRDLFEFNPATNAIAVKIGRINETRLSEINNTLYLQARYDGGTLPYGSLYSVRYYPPQENWQLRHAFELASGGSPVGPLVPGGSKGYGLTSYPPKIFEFDTQTKTYSAIYSFPSQDLYHEANMVLSGNKLYGASTSGEYLFQFDVDTHTIQELPAYIIDSYREGSITSLLMKEEVSCTGESIASFILDYQPGNRKDGQTISADRTIPQNALYTADNFDVATNGVRFASLGFGGSISLAFDQALCDYPGSDFRVVETSYGNPSFYHNPERAEVFVSSDGSNWVSLGLTSPHCTDKMDTDFDIASSGLSWIKYVKVADVSNPAARRRSETTCAEVGPYAFNDAADGFDLDAIEPISTEATARRPAIIASNIVEMDPSKTTALPYPNPVSNQLIFDFSQEEEMVLVDNDLQFEIIDINGRPVHRSVKTWDESWTIRHDVSELSTGLYIARVKNGNVRRYYKFLKD